MFTELYVHEDSAAHFSGISNRRAILEYGQRRLQGPLQFWFLLRVLDSFYVHTYATSAAVL